MRTMLAIAAVGFLASTTSAQPDEVEWKATRIDADSKEGFRCLRVDTLGRLFVGGRDAVFVYEPRDGGYQARRLFFRFPANSSVNDMEIRGSDLFVLTSTALYVLPDGARKRDELKPRKLLWGVPNGDVLRAMTWGPEGDLYLAFGNPAGPDRLASWTFFNDLGKGKTPFRGPGGILRCKPDGTDIRIVALGLRNPGAMVFDRAWNLFVTDIVKEASAQLWHVTPHANLRGDFPPLLDAVNPVLEIAEDGLVGANADELTRIALESKDASFRARASALLACKNAATVAAGAARIFVIHGQGEIDAFTGKDRAFTPYDASAASADKLWQELHDPSWHRRYQAHVEILRRGGDLLKGANQRILDAKPNDPALHHLIWLAAKSGRGSPHLLGCVSHADWRVRVQALRALAEFPEQLRDEPIFTKALLDDDLHVQHAAVSAFFAPKVGWDRAIQAAIERGPACSKDPLLRQTAALLLAHKATRKQLEDLCASGDAAKRLAGVMAIGYRLMPPGSTTALPQHLPLKPFGDASANVIEYADGKVDLRAQGRIGTYKLAEHFAADKHADDVHSLFKVLRRMANDEDKAVRFEAARLLRIAGNLSLR